MKRYKIKIKWNETIAPSIILIISYLRSESSLCSTLLTYSSVKVTVPFGMLSVKINLAQSLNGKFQRNRLPKFPKITDPNLRILVYACQVSDTAVEMPNTENTL